MCVLMSALAGMNAVGAGLQAECFEECPVWICGFVDVVFVWAGECVVIMACVDL